MIDKKFRTPTPQEFELFKKKILLENRLRRGDSNKNNTGFLTCSL